LFNEGLRELLSAQPDLNVCGQVFESKDVPFALQRHDPDLVLLDLNLRGNSGLDIGKQIRATAPRTKILILTMHDQPRLLHEARRAGFEGYLLKDTIVEDLLAGIRTVLAGRTHFDPNLDPVAATPPDPFGDDFARQANLSFREVEVIRLVREGLTNEQIAERLSLAVLTIKTHRKNIHFKLGVSNVAELIQFAAKHGI